MCMYMYIHAHISIHSDVIHSYHMHTNVSHMIQCGSEAKYMYIVFMF